MDYRPNRKLDVWKKSMELVREIKTPLCLYYVFSKVMQLSSNVLYSIYQYMKERPQLFPKRPIEELIEFVAGRLGLKPKLICSGSRQQKYSEARSLVAWLAVEETGHKLTDVARILGVKRASIKQAVVRGKTISDKYPVLLEKRT